MPIGPNGCPDNDWKVTDPLPYLEGTAPCMYAGFVEVNSASNHNLFYWMFRHDDDTKPVIVYLEGGPGSSSVGALFVENGPFRVSFDKDKEYVVKQIQGSWASLGHLVFLDQPVGTGFSYGNEMITSLSEGKDDFISFLKKFYETYPEFKGNDLILTGQSFGGKYLPIYATGILDDNKGKAQADQIPLKAVIAMNPLINDFTQRLENWQEGYALGILDDQQMGQVDAVYRQCEHSVSNDQASKISCNFSSLFEVYSAGVYYFDDRIFNEDWNKLIAAPVQYMTSLKD